MNNSLIITTPQAMSAPPAGTPVLRVPGDEVVITSDAFNGANTNTLAGRYTDATTGGKPMPYQFINAASYGINNGQLVPGSSTSISAALVDITPSPADLKATCKITALPDASVTAQVSLLNIRRSSLESPASQVRLGFSGSNMSLFVFLGDSKQVYVPGSATPVAVGDVVGVREYNGLVQMFKNGVMVKEGQYPAGTFTGTLAGITNTGGAVFGFDDFRVTETIH